MTKLKRWPPCISLYLIAFGISLVFLMNHAIPTSDWGEEFTLFLKDANTGWVPIRENMLNTCLFTTLIPALIVQGLHINPLLTYNLYLITIIPFLPVSGYLLYSRLTSRNKAFLISLFLATNCIFLRGMFYCRNIIACIFFSVILLVMVEKTNKAGHYLILAVAALGIVFSHYAVAYISILFFIALLVLGTFFHLGKRLILQTIIVIVILVLAATVWYSYSLETTYYYPQIINQVLENPQFNPQPQDAQTGTAIFDFRISLLSWLTGLIFFAIILRTAIIYQGKVKPFIAAYTMVFLLITLSFDQVILALGLFTLIFKRENKLLACLASIAAVAVLLVNYIPYATSGYGGARMYFQMLLPLGVCFNYGAEKLGNALKLNKVLILSLILGLYFFWTWWGVSV